MHFYFNVLQAVLIHQYDELDWKSVDKGDQLCCKPLTHNNLLKTEKVKVSRKKSPGFSIYTAPAWVKRSINALNSRCFFFQV